MDALLLLLENSVIWHSLIQVILVPVSTQKYVVHTWVVASNACFSKGKHACTKIYLNWTSRRELANKQGVICKTALLLRKKTQRQCLRLKHSEHTWEAHTKPSSSRALTASILCVLQPWPAFPEMSLCTEIFWLALCCYLLNTPTGIEASQLLMLSLSSLCFC